MVGLRCVHLVAYGQVLSAVKIIAFLIIFGLLFWQESCPARYNWIYNIYSSHLTQYIWSLIKPNNVEHLKSQFAYQFL